MSLEGKAGLKVEEVVQSANGNWEVNNMWNALNCAFVPINHRESRYRQFATRHMRHGEWMTEYLDKLIRLFRKNQTRNI